MLLCEHSSSIHHSYECVIHHPLRWLQRGDVLQLDELKDICFKRLEDCASLKPPAPVLVLSGKLDQALQPLSVPCIMKMFRLMMTAKCKSCARNCMLQLESGCKCGPSQGNYLPCAACSRCTRCALHKMD